MLSELLYSLASSHSVKIRTAKVIRIFALILEKLYGFPMQCASKERLILFSDVTLSSTYLLHFMSSCRSFSNALFLQVAYTVMHIIYYSHLFKPI